MDIVLTDGGDNSILSPGELQPGFALYALRGRDTVTGSTADEIIYAGKDNDDISSGGGNDLVNGNNEQDFIDGGDGNDTVRGGKGSDVVIGGNGNDFIYGDRDADIIVGNDGSDTFILFADSTLPPESQGDLLVDFDPINDGDRLGLLGLTPDEIVIQEASILRDDFFPLLPTGTTAAQLVERAQIPPDILDTPPQGRSAFALLTPSGESLALIANTTEAEIRSGLVTVTM